MPLRLHEQAAVHLISTNSRRGPARHLPVNAPRRSRCSRELRNANARTGTSEESDVIATTEYWPLIIYAVVFFIGPAVIGAIGFWWFWRDRRARVQSLHIDHLRETRRQPRVDLLIVRRGDLGLYQRFRSQLAADPTVKVITDRRWAERRRDSLGHESDRRRGDRRCDEPYVSLALRSAGWVEVGMRRHAE
jgi:hypothetical protein